MSTAADREAAAARERERAHLVDTVLPEVAQEELNLVTAVKSSKGTTIAVLVEALEDVQRRAQGGRGAPGGPRPVGEIDLESYRAEVDKLRSRWKDWEGAMQGDGGKDVELGHQVIKKLLSTPVFANPTEAGAWEWTAVGTFEGMLKGYVGKRPIADQPAAKPEEVAAADPGRSTGLLPEPAGHRGRIRRSGRRG